MLTRREEKGKKTVEARLAAKGYRDPDLRNGNVGIAGCVSRRSSHLQRISLGDLKKWAIWISDIKNALLEADGFGRGAPVRAPCEWNSKHGCRVWRLRAPAYGLNEAPVPPHRPLRRKLANSAESLTLVGLRVEASSFDPHPYFVSR